MKDYCYVNNPPELISLFMIIFKNKEPPIINFQSKYWKKIKEKNI